MTCRWRYFKTTDSSELVTGWVKSNRYLPFPEKEWKNIKFHKGSLRIACSKWRDCEHAIIQQVPLRVQFVLSSGVISRVQFVISRKIADTKTLGIDSETSVIYLICGRAVILS